MICNLDFVPLFPFPPPFKLTKVLLVGRAALKVKAEHFPASERVDRRNIVAPIPDILILFSDLYSILRFSESYGRGSKV